VSTRRRASRIDEELANNLDKLANPQTSSATWEGTEPSANLGLAYVDVNVDGGVNVDVDICIDVYVPR
jgi:hypothetical protein